MISSLCWIPKGVAKEEPIQAELTEEELAALKAAAGGEGPEEVRWWPTVGVGQPGGVGHGGMGARLGARGCGHSVRGQNTWVVGSEGPATGAAIPGAAAQPADSVAARAVLRQSPSTSLPTGRFLWAIVPAPCRRARPRHAHSSLLLSPQ